MLKTKFEQYLSTNSALEKILEGNYDLRRSSLPTKRQRINNLTKQNKKRNTHTERETIKITTEQQNKRNQSLMVIDISQYQ